MSKKWTIAKILKILENSFLDPKVHFGTKRANKYFFCIFVIFVLPLYYFLGGSWGSLGPSTAAERRVTIHCKYAGIGALASYDFSTWPFWKFLKSALLLFGGPVGTRGLPRKGKKFRLRSFDPALVRKTDRLHVYNGFWRPVPSHLVKMQRFEPSHGAL